MKRINIKATLIEAIALFFVILFLYTGAAKLMEYDVFKQQIGESPILKPIAPVVAWLLPVIEFVVAILLFFPRTRLKGLYAALGLMTIFTIYIILILNFSPEIPCSCGGIISELSWTGHIIFNGASIIAATWAIWASKQTIKLNTSTPLSFS